MPPRWWRRAIDRRLKTLAAISLVVWVAAVAAAAGLTAARFRAAVDAERDTRARRVADRMEHAIDAELQRLYRQPGESGVPVAVQLARAVTPLAGVLREYSQEPYRVVLVDARGRELAASALEPAGRSSAVLSSTVPIGRTGWFIRLEQPNRMIAEIDWLRRLLVLSAVLSCALAVLFAWGTAQSIRRPIVRLTADARRLAEGELSQRIAPAGEDEIGALAGALEEMRQALARAFHQVSTANAELERRVADRTRELTRLYEALQAQDARRGQLLRKVIGAQEEERKRLARELHDETTQQLTVLGLQLDMLAELTAGRPRAASKVADARALVGRMLDDLHRVIFDLRPSMLDDLGLLPAIRWYADRRLGAGGIAVRCEFPETPPELSSDVRTAVFRVVQEALMNIERHARAETVLIACAVADGELTIEVEDDGIGFDQADVQQPAESGRGLGLLGMRERLALLGGQLVVESEPGRGTRVVVRVPVVDCAFSTTRT